MPSRLTIADAARRYRDGSLTPRDVVDECLRRIESFDARVRAWVAVDADGARRAADRLGAELRGGRDRGMLHGIPLGVKDIIDVAGMPTRAGSPLRADWPPADEHAPVVGQLVEAGAIVLGKTVTTEFACFDPPPTRNPWNLAHTPGGSSSGSAAAVAMGMCLGAVGTQTGGSITRPASYCGVASCKPTFGRVSTQGVAPISQHLDHVGPLAGDLHGAAVMLQAMTDPCQAPADETLLSLPTDTPPRIYRASGFFRDAADDEVRSTCDSALQRLVDQGLHLEWLTDLGELPFGNAATDKIDLMRQILAWHRTIMAVEAAEVHRETFPARRGEYGACLASLLDEGRDCDDEVYRRALDALCGLRNWLPGLRTMLQNLRRVGSDAPSPVLVCYATTTAAPSRDTTGDPSFNAPWSFLGTPTVSIPCGLTTAGLPVSLQFVGRPGAEAQVIAVAAWCERALGFDLLPPMLE